MLVRGTFLLVGRFVLNGNIDAKGTVDISSGPPTGQEEAVISFHEGQLTNPNINIKFNFAAFDRLADVLRAAHSVEIDFTSSRDLMGELGGRKLDSFNISARRKFE
jgi:hypothetical protein